MKRIKGERGITTVELLVVMAVGSILLGSLVAVIINSGRVTSHATTNISALEDIKAVAASIVQDVRMAQEIAILEEGRKLVLGWTRVDPDDPDLTPVSYGCEYTYLEGSFSIERSYWREDEPESTRTYGSYLTKVFFENDGSGRNMLVTITISSSPPGSTGETLIYKVNAFMNKESS